MIHLDGRSRSTLDRACSSIADGRETVALDADAARARRCRARRRRSPRRPATSRSTASTPGFGSFAEVKIPRDALGELQRNLLRSHAAGVGEPLPVRAVRAMMALRANVLAKGFSGIRRGTLEALIALLNRARPPARAVPRLGRRQRRPRAAGASGARADRRGRAPRSPTRRSVLERARCARCAPGWRRSTLAAEGRPRADQRHAAVDGGRCAGAARRRAARARRRHRRRAVDRRAARLVPSVRAAHLTTPRPYPGQRASAANIDAADARTARSTSRTSTAGGCRTPTRCAARRRCTARRARRCDFVRANARDRSQRRDRQPDGLRRRRATSSPAATSTARRSRSPPICSSSPLAQLATISERRADRLVNPALSGLPAFLTRDSGLHSGFMMAQVTAAALASELKTLAHPASVDTIPTSANHEDHVSMSMARRAQGANAPRARHARRRRSRLLLRVPGDRPAGAARPRRRRSQRVHATRARTRADARSTIVRRRPISSAIAELIATGALERACAAEVK